MSVGWTEAGDYKLPSGLTIRPGERCRVPSEHLWMLPVADRALFTLGRDWSSGSEVLEMRPDAARAEEGG
jgi:hypothetical protein